MLRRGVQHCLLVPKFRRQISSSRPAWPTEGNVEIPRPNLPPQVKKKIETSDFLKQQKSKDYPQ